MKLIQHRHSVSGRLYSQTLLHLLEWLEALQPLLDTEECPFADASQLAEQMEVWRSEFQANCGNHTAAKEPVLVLVYANQVILICNQQSGEFIKLTVIPPLP